MSGRVSKPSARVGSFDAWDLRLLHAAGQLAALVLEIERPRASPRELLASPTEPVQKRTAVGKEGAAALPIVRKPCARLRVRHRAASEHRSALHRTRGLGSSEGGTAVGVVPQHVSHISAAFFHNDDMALAALEVMKARNRTDIRVGGVDAMPPAIHAVLDGRMHATVRNPSCRIHGGAIVAGVEAALAPRKTPAAPPKHIIIDGPIVTPANVPGLLWMEGLFLI